MNSPCRDHKNRLIEGALAAEFADRELAAHLSNCSECAAHHGRVQRTARAIAGLARQSAPLELDGRAVAACEAGFRQERVVGEIFGLVRAGAPSELEARVLGPGGALRRAAPPVLERLIDEDLHDPKKAIARRYGGRLGRVAAPESLRQRVTQAFARGFAPERQGVSRRLVGSLAVFALAIAAAVWWRAHEALPAPSKAEFTVTRMNSLDELDPFAKALFDGLSGGVSELVGTGASSAPKLSPTNSSAAGSPTTAPPTDVTPDVNTNASRDSATSPTGPASSPELAPTANGNPRTPDARGGSSQPDISIQVCLPLIERMVRAPQTVAFHGQRHVVLPYTSAGVPQTLDYTEDVWSDGQGRFSVDPLTLASPPMTTTEAQLFALTQKLREGFLYRMRDFNVRDPQQFLSNYSLQDVATSVIIAGRVCQELRATLQQNATSSFLVDVDPITALVMRVNETATDGSDLGTTEFTSFALNPDLSGVVLHTDFVVTPLDITPGTDTVAQIGFNVWAPQTLPTGFALRSSENVDDGVGHHWARMSYCDGAQQLFCLHTLLPPAQVGGGVPEGLLAMTWVGQRTVKVFHVGPWCVAQGYFGLDEIVAVGKCSQSQLVSMIKSAVQ